MTLRTLRTIEALGLTAELVDRRFSRDVAEIGMASPRKFFAAIGLAWRLLRSSFPRPLTVVFFVTNRPGSFIVDWILIQILRARKVHAVAYIHTTGFTALAARGKAWGWLVRGALSYFRRVVVLGSSLRPDISKWVDPSRITEIANATGVLEERAARPSSPLRVLFLSNLIEEKGPLLFVQLASSFVASGREAEFRMAGYPAETEVVAAVEKASNMLGHSRLKYLGGLDAAARDEALKWADVLVFPSTYRYEAQPLTIIEAFAASTPVLAFDVGGIRDIVIDGENGHLVAPADIGALEDALARLSSDGEALDKLRDGARDRFHAHHSLGAFEQSWGRVFHGVSHDSADDTVVRRS
ncbi:glycosyltransferase family 4 protein (plasmid) [Coraliomargarita sp. W4R53]